MPGENDTVQFFKDMVETYLSVFVNVLGFVGESAKDQECVS